MAADDFERALLKGRDLGLAAMQPIRDSMDLTNPDNGNLRGQLLGFLLAVAEGLWVTAISEDDVEETQKVLDNALALALRQAYSYGAGDETTRH